MIVWWKSASQWCVTIDTIEHAQVWDKLCDTSGETFEERIKNLIDAIFDNHVDIEEEPVFQITWGVATLEIVIPKEVETIIPEKTEEHKPSPQDLLRAEYIECKEANDPCMHKVWRTIHWIPEPVVKTLDVKWLITYYANQLWVSQSKAHRVAYCESKYNRCAKFWVRNQNCSVSERALMPVWNGTYSSASWVYQFVNSTRDHYSTVYWRHGESKYNADANIFVALSMFRDGLSSHRVCK